MGEEDLEILPKESFDADKFYDIETEVEGLQAILNIGDELTDEDIKQYNSVLLKNFDILNTALRQPSRFATAIRLLSIISDLFPDSRFANKALSLIVKNFDKIRDSINTQDLNTSLACLKAVNSLRKNGDMDEELEAKEVLINNADIFFQGLEPSGYHNPTHYISLMPYFNEIGDNRIQDKIAEKSFKLLSDKRNIGDVAYIFGQMSESKDIVERRFAGLTIAGYLWKIGIVSPKAVWNQWDEGRKTLARNIENNLPIIARLESKYPSIVKFLSEKFNVRDFALYSSYVIELLENKYQQYLDSDRNSYNPVENEEKLLRSYGLDPDKLFQAWRESHREWLWALKCNLETIKMLESHKSGLSQFLNHEFRIENFGRYPVDLLIRQFDGFENTSLPYGIIFYPKSDYNGAFYENIAVFANLSLDLYGQFALRVFEVGSENDIAKALVKLDKLYGQNHKISFAIIGGHGTRDTVEFSKGSKRGEVTTDTILKRRFKRTKDFFEPDGQIILISCETGTEGGIAQTGSNFIQLAVDGPKEMTNIKALEVHISKDKKHIRLSVEYREGATGSYFSGLDVSK